MRLRFFREIVPPTVGNGLSKGGVSTVDVVTGGLEGSVDSTSGSTSSVPWLVGLRFGRKLIEIRTLWPAGSSKW